MKLCPVRKIFCPNKLYHIPKDKLHFFVLGAHILKGLTLFDILTVTLASYMHKSCANIMIKKF